MRSIFEILRGVSYVSAGYSDGARFCRHQDLLCRIQKVYDFLLTQDAKKTNDLTAKEAYVVAVFDQLDYSINKYCDCSYTKIQKRTPPT